VADGVDHVERAMGRAVVLDVAGGNIHGEELRGDAAGLERGDVGMAVVFVLADIIAIDGAAGDVVMSVDQDGGTMDALDLGVGHRTRLGEGEAEGDTEKAERSHA
jgi:hypothetical protein